MNSSHASVVITGGAATARTAAGARLRAQLKAGLPAGVASTQAHNHGPVEHVVHGPEAVAPAGTPHRAYTVEAVSSTTQSSVWACLVWGHIGENLFVVGFDGDTRGGVLEQGQRVVDDLSLANPGIALEGATATSGTRACVTLTAVTVLAR